MYDYIYASAALLTSRECQHAQSLRAAALPLTFASQFYEVLPAIRRYRFIWQVDDYALRYYYARDDYFLLHFSCFRLYYFSLPLPRCKHFVAYAAAGRRRASLHHMLLPDESANMPILHITFSRIGWLRMGLYLALRRRVHTFVIFHADILRFDVFRQCRKNKVFRRRRAVMNFQLSIFTLLADVDLPLITIPPMLLCRRLLDGLARFHIQR